MHGCVNGGCARLTCLPRLCNASRMTRLAALPAFVLAPLMLAACGQNAPETRSEPGAPESLAPFAVGEMADFQATNDGGPPPEVTLTGAGGATYALTETFGANATLVNLWATWCAPCVVEMPALNELQRDYGAQGLAVVAINLDNEAQKGLDFYEQRELESLGFHHDPVLIAPSLFETQSLPLTVIYDSRGVEIGRTWGAPDWAGPEGRALIEAALAMGRAGGAS